MKVIKTIAELRTEILPLKKAGKKIAFVPTMGYLHEGHLSLFRLGKALGDILVIEVRVYDSAPAASIVAADPSDQRNGQLFVEHYLYSKRWSRRLCLRVCAKWKSDLFKSYRESLETLLRDDHSRVWLD